MNVASRPVSTGKTRTCPHCKATILESLSICPGCLHHLRFDSEAAKRQVAAAPALRVEGLIRHPPNEQPLEYFVVIAVRNDRGEEVTRQVVNVGALQAAEKRTFTLSVEVLPPQAPPPSKSAGSTGTFKSPLTQPTATIRAPTPPQSPPAASSGAKSTSASSSGGTGSISASPSAASASSTGTPVGAAKPSSTHPTAGTKASPSPPAPGSSTINVTKKPESGYALKPPNPGGPKRH
jgi:hypothetical protein